MLTYCAPCPGNMNTTGFSFTASEKEVSFSRADRAPSISPQTIVLLKGKSFRPTLSVYAASARSVSGFSVRWRARLAALASRALRVFADSRRRCLGRIFFDGLCRGASSSTIWALVPPKPKALTPALLGKPSLSHFRSLVLIWKGLLAKSIFGFGVSK